MTGIHTSVLKIISITSHRTSQHTPHNNNNSNMSHLTDTASQREWDKLMDPRVYRNNTQFISHFLHSRDEIVKIWDATGGDMKPSDFLPVLEYCKNYKSPSSLSQRWGKPRETFRSHLLMNAVMLDLQLPDVSINHIINYHAHHQNRFSGQIAGMEMFSDSTISLWPHRLMLL